MKRVMLLFIVFPLLLYGNIPYRTKISGDLASDVIEFIQNNSDLISQEIRPPENETLLKKRIEADITNLTHALQTFAFYHPNISYKINRGITPYEVVLEIDTGPVYPFKGGIVYPELMPVVDLGIIKGEPAYPKTIHEAEERLLLQLSRHSYPFAKLIETKVIADQQTKEVLVTFHIELGEKAFFGPVSIKGNHTVDSRLIFKKMSWKEGDPFNSDQILKTIQALESLGLFRAVTITYSEDGDADLPILIEVEEAKHRSIAIGLSYSTQRGPGFTFEWEHRNVMGLGHHFSFDANVLQYIQELKAQYVLPDFLSPCQSLILSLEVEHDDTDAFEETWGSLSAMVERRVSPHLRLSYGMLYKQLYVGSSDQNGSYGLFKTPLQLRWSNANDLLDPSSGATLFFKTIPTGQFSDSPSFYTVNYLSGAYYIPFADGKFVLASKGQLGSILGSSIQGIPVSERLFAGSETTLRGYGYYTVSPLDEDGKPIGGRSLSVFSLEGRWRVTEKWGTALFYDVGNVYSSAFPTFDGKWLQSAGLGVRYYTPVGPLRLDIAFPLNRRKHLDGPFQFYFSVGQAF